MASPWKVAQPFRMSSNAWPKKASSTPRGPSLSIQEKRFSNSVTDCCSPKIVCSTWSSRRWHPGPPGWRSIVAKRKSA